MHAGVPSIVTQLTGTRSEVRAVDGGMVVDANTDSIAEGVKRYFNQPQEERESLSERYRERGRRFDAASQKRNFRSAFQHVHKQICDRNHL